MPIESKGQYIVYTAGRLLLIASLSLSSYGQGRNYGKIFPEDLSRKSKGDIPESTEAAQPISNSDSAIVDKTDRLNIPSRRFGREKAEDLSSKSETEKIDEDDTVREAIPENNDEFNISFGGNQIDLSQPFTMIVPKELVELADLRNPDGSKIIGEQEYEINPDAITDDTITPEVSEKVADFNQNPNYAPIFTTDTPTNYFVNMHDLYFQRAEGNWIPLPAEWLRTLYNKHGNNPDVLEGKYIIFQQSINGKIVNLTLSLLGFTEIEASEFQKEDNLGGLGLDPNGDPIFYKLENLGFGEEKRVPNTIQIGSCFGEKNTETGFNKRIILSATATDSEALPDSKPEDNSEIQNKEDAESEVGFNETAIILHDAINRANDKGIKHGEDLANAIRNYLIAYGIYPDDELETELADAARQTNVPEGQKPTSDRFLQCLEFVELLSRISEKVPKVSGWQLFDKQLGNKRPLKNAAEFWLDEETGERIPYSELSEGDVVNTQGVVRFMADVKDPVGSMEVGDLIVIDPQIKYLEPNPNHIAVVVKKWIDENGEPHIYIADANSDEEYNPGKARIEDVTKHNLDRVLYGGELPEGVRGRILILSTYDSYEDGHNNSDLDDNFIFPPNEVNIYKPIRFQ